MPRVLLGVCGGIAAYKSCELVRELQRRGAEVRVVMTAAATKFVTPLTFEALTKAPVGTDLFGDGAFGTAHIEWARGADLFVVAPATANTLAKLARGAADDFLSTLYLAFRGPVILAPAMNTAMWEHPAVRANLERLASRGARVIDPEAGELACGEQGIGKMADPIRIADEVLGSAPPRSLAGKRVVVTAGPTREYLDPVRFLSNPSTGEMGLAVAREAVLRGARVTVVHGPLAVRPDFAAEFVPVVSAKEMADAVAKLLPCDVFVGTAAVSDYRPASPSPAKLKKVAAHLDVRLERTEDILAGVAARRRPGDLAIGFAAETEDAVPHAKLKLEKKGLDLIVANRVAGETLGFGGGPTSAAILGRKGLRAELDRVSKAEVARRLWDEAERLREDRP